MYKYNNIVATQIAIYYKNYETDEFSSQGLAVFLALMEARCIRGTRKHIVQLPNGVLAAKHVLESGNRSIVDFVTWTCPELKSPGCQLGTTRGK